MSNQVFILLLVAVCSTQAFIFSRTDTIARSEGREIEESCLALADQGSCEFYTCFERRLPCGRQWYIEKQGRYYCNKIDRMMDDFPDEVQVFLRDSQKCLTMSLKDAYREDMLSCHDLEHDAVEEISNCYADNAFCTALRGNLARFLQIYETDDLLSSGAGKIWQEIATLALQCGSEGIADLSQIASEHISDTVDTVVDSVRNTFSNLFDFKKKK